MKFKNFFILLVLMCIAVIMSCRSRESRAVRQAYKYEKHKLKENEKMIAEYHEHHFKIQPLETQSMIKTSKKRANQINKRRSESWVSRTFKRKRSKNCNGN